MIIKKIDDYFYERGRKDFIYMIVAISMGIGFVFLYFLYPQINNFESKNEKNYKKLTKELKDEKFDLNLKKLKSLRLEKDVKIIKKELVALKKKEELYKELTSLLDFAKFNQQKWGDFVKDLIFKANKNMEVKLIENKLDTNSTGLISKKLEIGMDLTGDYKDFINFIYHYENLKELIRINKVDINSSSNFYVKFELYGYER